MHPYRPVYFFYSAFQTVNTSSYRIVETEETWHDAQAKCQAGQGNLVTITDEFEFNLLMARLW